MKKIILTSFMLCSVLAFSQEIKFGAKVGLNLSNLRGNYPVFNEQTTGADEADLKNKSVIGFHIGVKVDPYRSVSRLRQADTHVTPKNSGGVVGVVDNVVGVNASVYQEVSGKETRLKEFTRVIVSAKDGIEKGDVGDRGHHIKRGGVGNLT